MDREQLRDQIRCMLEGRTEDGRTFKFSSEFIQRVEKILESIDIEKMEMWVAPTRRGSIQLEVEYAGDSPDGPHYLEAEIFEDGSATSFLEMHGTAYEEREEPDDTKICEEFVKFYLQYAG